jgi:exopolyphosphatase / guanosine-5'-triphosphate,3'-diphosphate pyrophosphatase
VSSRAQGPRQPAAPIPEDDRHLVTQLLGREPQGDFEVAVRGRDGRPVVIANAPFLGDGRPMPTRYWLVDPALRDEVSRLEAAGGVRRATAALPPESVAEAHARYTAEREKLVPPGAAGPLPSGGVGGTRRGIKCLHAHLAWYLAGGDDPVGLWTASQLALDTRVFVPGFDSRPGPRAPVAAVDCGTNSTRLLVVSEDGSVLERGMRITRLGEGVDATGTLSEGAIDRTLAVLRDYKQAMDDHGVRRARVVATSAARDAGNADAFSEGVAAIFGAPPEILSGEEEGRLSFAGATAHLPATDMASGPILVVDIGGGSTELSVGPGAAGLADVPQVVTRSLDIGCVRVSERFLRHDPPRRDELWRAREAVVAEVDGARGTLPAVRPDGLLIGLAGTVSTLASLDAAITEYERALVHHAVLGQDAVDRWLEMLASESASDRLSHPGMVKGREDVIVGGALVLSVVMTLFSRPRCLVSEDDILDGLVATLG